MTAAIVPDPAGGSGIVDKIYAFMRKIPAAVLWLIVLVKLFLPPVFEVRLLPPASPGEVSFEGVVAGPAETAALSNPADPGLGEVLGTAVLAVWGAGSLAVLALALFRRFVAPHAARGMLLQESGQAKIHQLDIAGCIYADRRGREVAQGQGRILIVEVIQDIAQLSGPVEQSGFRWLLAAILDHALQRDPCWRLGDGVKSAAVGKGINKAGDVGVAQVPGEPGLADEPLDELADPVQMHVARHAIGVAVDDGDERLVEVGFLFDDARRPQQAAVRRPLDTFFDRV